jgi:signal transduction histidine kinase
VRVPASSNRRETNPEAAPLRIARTRAESGLRVRSFHHALKSVRPLQMVFIVLLIVCSALLAYWMTDEVRYTSRVQAQLREAYEAEAQSASVLLRSGAAWRQVALTHPEVALSADSSTVQIAPRVLAELKSSRFHRLNRYAWEGSFFLAVLLAAMVVVLRAVREEAELRERQENFLAAVSHELKSPLASLRLSVETLAMRDPPPERRAELVHRLLADLGRLQRMIANILDTSRLSAAETRSAPERVELAEAVSSVVDELREHAVENDVSLDTDVAESLVIWADPEGVRTVLRNLLHNGIRAASGGRHVAVRAFRTDGWVQLEVRDDGVGFPPQEAAHLFDKFYRVDGGGPGRASGTGLGLYLVWRCVSLDGGRVTCESAGPGRGASFTASWPASTEDSA